MSGLERIAQQFPARRACGPVLAACGLALAACLLGSGLPAQAQVVGHPFPPLAEHANPLAAPGLLSGPRPPLGVQPASGYAVFLSQHQASTTRPLALGLLRFYRNVVSPVNGSNSDLAPTPSLYAVRAIQLHGALMGSLLTTGRLIQEPSLIPYAPRFIEGDRTFFYDPLRWNVYWLPIWLQSQ